MAPPSRQKPWWVEKREHQSEWRLLPPRPASQSPAPLRHLVATTEVRQHDWSKPGGGSTDGAWPNPSSQPIPGQARSSRRPDRVRQRDRSEARRRRHGRGGVEPTTGQPVQARRWLLLPPSRWSGTMEGGAKAKRNVHRYTDQLKQSRWWLYGSRNRNFSNQRVTYIHRHYTHITPHMSPNIRNRWRNIEGVEV